MARQPRRLMRQGVADLQTRAQVDAYTGPNGEVISDGDTLRLQDGATPGGVSLVSLRGRLLASFTGAVPRLLADLLFAQCHAAIFGVVANTGVDQGPALRRAITYAQSRGAELILPEGEMQIGPDPDDAEAVLRITKLMNLRGAGRNSLLIPMQSVGSRHIILVKPAANAGGIRGMVLRDFSIAYLGDRYGGDGIRFDTTNHNGFIAKPLVQNVGIADAGAGKYAIHHVNNPDEATGNINGGLFAGTFCDCDLWGGVKFEKTGDSNNFFCNIMTGNNAGIDYEAIGGAAMHLFEGNNITSSGGSVILRNTIQAKLHRNQLEGYFPYTGNDNEKALIILDGCYDCEVSENNANGYARVDIVLLKNGSSKNTIAMNSVRYSTAQNKVLLRAVGAPGNILGKQRSDANEDNGFARSRPLLAVDAASLPTVGVFQQLTLGSGWAPGGDANYFVGLFAALTPDGKVHFRGSTGISGGTQAGIIAVLPPAMRPALAVRIKVAMYIDANSWGVGIFTVDTSGNISVQNVPNKAVLQWDDVSFSILPAA